MSLSKDLMNLVSEDLCINFLPTNIASCVNNHRNKLNSNTKIRLVSTTLQLQVLWSTMTEMEQKSTDENASVLIQDKG